MKNNRLNLIFSSLIIFSILMGALTGHATNPEVSIRSCLELLKQIEATDPDKKNEIEAALLTKLAELNDSGKLKVFLSQLIRLANAKGKLPMKIDSEEGLNALVEQFYGMVDATLIDRGLSARAPGKKYITWQVLDQKFQKELSDFEPSEVTSVEFKKQFSKMTKSALRRGNLSQLLVDGPESFEARRLAILHAKKEITMLTWALYDDATGAMTSDLLIQKAKEGLKVRVMVDAQTARRPHYNLELKKLEASGVEVIYWQLLAPEKMYLGQHRKMLIVDREMVIMGGMNPGDVYSHMAQDSKNHWRDTDVLVRGAVARDAHNIFARLWNGQIKINNLKLKKLEYTAALRKDRVGDDLMALVDHSPDNTLIDPIYLGTLFAIRSAKHSVDIENAYVVATPSLQNEIFAAIKRGVRVRILSNSDKSVDEPIVSRPIMLSLKAFAAAGAEVYLRKGSTLHSKFMLVDGQFAMIGSYNFHPRSLRYEGEVSLGVFAGSSVERLNKQFENDINSSVAEKVTDSEQIVLPPAVLNGLPEAVFFDQI